VSHVNRTDNPLVGAPVHPATPLVLQPNVVDALPAAPAAWHPIVALHRSLIGVLYTTSNEPWFS